MNKYIWRKNFAGTVSGEKKVEGKVNFKTKTIDWVETDLPVLIPISIHSAFHEEINGDLKMNALVSILKQTVKGKITILFTEYAHVKTLSLNHSNCLNTSSKICLADAQKLKKRYDHYFEGCNIEFWHSYIYEDAKYEFYKNKLRQFFQENLKFQDIVKQDVEITYTIERQLKTPDRNLFMQMGIEDILEQCAGILVLAKKGYRFQFYPGSPFESFEHVTQTLCSDEDRLNWVNVNLNIEKKKFLD